MKGRTTELEPGKSKYEITVLLVRAIVWPAMVLFLLFLYRNPIGSVVAQLPSLVASSSTVSVAGVSVQVDRRLRSQASAEALASLSTLSAEGVRALMDLADKTPIYNPDDVRVGRVNQEYGELLNSGLAELHPWTGEGIQPGSQGVRVTDRGRRTQELCYLIIADFAGQIAAAAKSESSPQE